MWPGEDLVVVAYSFRGVKGGVRWDGWSSLRGLNDENQFGYTKTALAI